MTDKALDTWFDGLGFCALERFMGTPLLDYGQAIAYCNSAKDKWDSLSFLQKYNWYEELGFDDHVNFSEVEFLTKIAA